MAVDKKKLMSKLIQIPRYAPFSGILNMDWDDGWTEEKKLDAVLAGGGDWPTHISSCVDEQILSTAIVLKRIQEFVEKKEVPTDDFLAKHFDLNGACDELQVRVSALNDLLAGVGALDVQVEKLLLIMFELGSCIGAIENQDYILRGKESIVQKHRANVERQVKVSPQAAKRKSAYFKLFDAMQVKDIKITDKGVRIFLKALDEKFDTETIDCDHIWLDQKNRIFDSTGELKSLNNYIASYKSLMNLKKSNIFA